MGKYDNVKTSKEYYSQNDEERFAVDFFGGSVGRFLDIGAFDGINLSNTRKLLELGWSGVMVEPSPGNFLELMKNCHPFSDRVVLVLASVSGAFKMVKMWIDETENREWSVTINKDLASSG